MRNTSSIDPFRPPNANISATDLAQSQNILHLLQHSMHQHLVGKENLITVLLVGLLSGGHVMVESASGLAKTTSLRTLASITGGTFTNIQCTADLTSADILGSRMFNQAKNTYEAQLGPAFVNFLMLGDLNFAPAKVQNNCLALLEQRQVVVEQMIYRAPKVFFTVATQQPVESEQTTALTSPQLDRFYLKERLTYPTVSEEVRILDHIEQDTTPIQPTVSLEQIVYLQNLTKSVYVSEATKRYIAELVLATRYPERYLTSNLLDYIDTGASPRAAIAFMECGKALALLGNHTYVTPHDIQALRYTVLRHRLGLNFSAFHDGIAVEQLIDAIFAAVPIPTS